MKPFIFYITLLTASLSFSQEKDSDNNRDKALLQASQNAEEYVYEANEKLEKDDFISAETDYRKALSEQGANVAGAYNLGTSYYKKGHFDEALYRNQQALKNATTKVEKHLVLHNLGNILMQNKKCKEAVSAFKDALRNNPSDDETRYNYALAKECAKNQQDEGDDGDQKDENKDNKEKKDDQKNNKNQDGDNENNQDNQEENDDKQNQEDSENKEGDQKEDDKQNQQNKNQDNKGDKEQKQPKQQPGKLSPQQVKNLLRAMDAQEEKTQEKMNAQKTKGVIIQTDKDW